MHILFDARTAADGRTHGIARHARGILAALARRPGAHRFTVLGLTEDQLTELAPGASFTPAPCPIKPYSPAELLKLPAALNRLKDRGIDLYYSPTFMPPLASPFPVAFTIHDLIHLDFAKDYPITRRLAWQWMIAPRARKAVAVMTGSAWAGEQISRRLGVDPTRITVVGHGLEPHFHPRSHREIGAVREKINWTKPYLVVAGNAKSHKNMAAAVRAYQLLDRSRLDNLAVVVVGTRELDLPKWPGVVIRPDWLDDHELAALMSGAELTVFPSLAEGFGLPPLEALACGCPVVCCDIPVLREVVGEQAYYSPGGAPEDLAETIKQVLAQPRRAKTKAAQGREWGRRYTWPAAAAKLTDRFDRLAGELNR